jgi:hypothetical protein
MPPMSSDEMELRIAASEARTDTKFAQLLGSIETMKAELGGEFKALNARIAGVESDVSGIRFWIIGTGIAVLALTVGILAFGNDRFGLGVDLGTVADEAARRAVEQALPRQSLGTIDAERRVPGTASGER